MTEQFCLHLVFNTPRPHFSHRVVSTTLISIGAPGLRSKLSHFRYCLLYTVFIDGLRGWVHFAEVLPTNWHFHSNLVNKRCWRKSVLNMQCEILDYYVKFQGCALFTTELRMSFQCCSWIWVTKCENLNLEVELNKLHFFYQQNQSLSRLDKALPKKLSRIFLKDRYL